MTLSSCVKKGASLACSYSFAANAGFLFQSGGVTGGDADHL